jgi:organic radical activating enzyme
MYHVSEIFESIQGEGNYAGAYSLFVRFQYCNLACAWCDTKYTWNDHSGQHTPWTTEALKQRIAESRSQNIIFTGGEPTLYALDQLVIPGKKYHVETNGTLISTQRLDITLNSGKRFVRQAMEASVIKDFNWVVSPKLSNSGQSRSDESIKYWAKQPFAIFKFVTRNRQDLDEVEQWLSDFSIDRSKVYIALEGQTAASQLNPDMVDEMVRRGFHFSPRLHVLLWGNKREK